MWDSKLFQILPPLDMPPPPIFTHFLYCDWSGKTTFQLFLNLGLFTFFTPIGFPNSEIVRFKIIHVHIPLFWISELSAPKHYAPAGWRPWLEMSYSNLIYWSQCMSLKLFNQINSIFTNKIHIISIYISSLHNE